MPAPRRRAGLVLHRQGAFDQHAGDDQDADQVIGDVEIRQAEEGAADGEAG